MFDERKGDRRIEFRSIPLAELNDPNIQAGAVEKACEEVELLSTAGSAIDRERFLAAELSPVFFGSALTNFGVEHFLQGFLQTCPPPGDRESNVGPIPAARSEFAGFVFKIQANLDPRHRDRVAFVRVSAGQFQTRDGSPAFADRQENADAPLAPRLRQGTRDDGRGLSRRHPGSDQSGRFSSRRHDLRRSADPLRAAAAILAGVFRSVALCRHQPPQTVRAWTGATAGGRRHSGLFRHTAARRDPILAAVGELQFDVVRFRMESEYNTATQVEWLPYKLARWVDMPPEELRNLKLPYASRQVIDQLGHAAILFQSTWDVQSAERENPKVKFASIRTADHWRDQEPQTPVTA